MRRSAIVSNSTEHQSTTTTTTTAHLNNQQNKRSLEDYGFSSNLKRRRHLSPQNTNIHLPTDPDAMSSASLRKKSRTKSKNSSLDLSQEMNSSHDHQTPRKSSSRHSSSSIQQLNELNLPNWERICPNIDQILSHKHAQSGVFAHEVQLVQQELEALLSMSIVRQTIVKDLQHPSTPNNSDQLRLKIRKHQEAEHVYSSKKLVKKSSTSVNNHSHQRQTAKGELLDRQVTIAPVASARIDRIWSDVNNYYSQISSDDITNLKNLVEFHRQLENKLEQCQTMDSSSSLEHLNQLNYQPLNELADISAISTHYLDQTTLGTFQSKLYEHIGQTSPVYRTPISSPMHGRNSFYHPDNKDHGTSLRISPRLHPNEHHRSGLFSFPNIKEEDEIESSSSSIKSKKKNKFITSPSSTIKFQQRLQFVQNSLVDQHLSSNENVKRQLFPEMKSSKKRKTSTSTHCQDSSIDRFQSKISTLLSLVHECGSLTSSALYRARLQCEHDEIFSKLNSIEQEIEVLIEKLDTPSVHDHPTAATEKLFHHLTQLVMEWKNLEELFQKTQ